MTVAVSDVSVVVCAYSMERWSVLTEAVESLRQQTLRPREIIVVVDHNSELLQRARTQLESVLVVANTEHPGLSGARHSGFRAAQGTIVAFIDDDATAYPDWLFNLREAYRDPRVLGVGGAVEPQWAAHRPSWFPAEFQWVVGCSYLGMPTSSASVRNFIGCNMSFRRSVLDAVGGFRASLGRGDARPSGCEETELCIRAHRLRPQSVLLFEPRSRVRHRVPTGRMTWRYFGERCYAEGHSKAIVSRLAGRGDGLATERACTFRTLPRGLLRGLADAALRPEPGGAARAAAIVAGLALTTGGYLVGTFSVRIRRPKVGTEECAGQGALA